MKIYLDFDGTVVEHYYPKMGRANFGAVEVVKKLQDAGHEVILNTYRADCKDGTIEKALEYLNEGAWRVVKDRSKRNDFELKPIIAIKNKIHPAPWKMFDKDEIEIYGKEQGEPYIFIDDSATNMCLKRAVMTDGWMVDWDKVVEELIKVGILPLTMSFKLEIPQGVNVDELPMKLPMMIGWEHSTPENIIGNANISASDNELNIVCDTYHKDIVKDYLIHKNMFSVVVGGRVLKKTDNVIEEFELKSVNLTTNIKPKQ